MTPGAESFGQHTYPGRSGFPEPPVDEFPSPLGLNVAQTKSHQSQVLIKLQSM
jgi:hypothetical protein